ncbi:MAG: BlaI/MecI/CopY family transcriptional regulator [Bacteroidetes bacterium]|nr:BlaI/MecI/CopY family transcriptional regulator [Bacteroidota bacterium]MCH8123719.1 BlaI/MecI/CopY family transcriptional regulator [Bacteroidota bacterium]
MRRKSINPLGETELEVLHIIWDLKEATVAEVREQILRDRKVAYTTVMTVTRNLADKGYLSFKSRGNSYVYSAKLQAEDVRKSILREMVESVFKGSPLALVQTLTEDEELMDEEMEEIKLIINSMNREEEDHD